MTADPGPFGFGVLPSTRGARLDEIVNRENRIGAALSNYQAEVRRLRSRLDTVERNLLRANEALRTNDTARLENILEDIKATFHQASDLFKDLDESAIEATRDARRIRMLRGSD